jgi:NAD-dependent SIR2 family protein deacetylase
MPNHDDDNDSGAHYEEEHLFCWTCGYCGMADGYVEDKTGKTTGKYVHLELCRPCGNDFEKLRTYTDKQNKSYRVCDDCAEELNINSSDDD